MNNINAHSHLTLEERRIIMTGICNGSTKTAIAKTIGKDKSTIGKEIKLHRSLTHKCSLPLECDNYRTCRFNRECTPECPGYIQFHCSRRDRSPGACNKCSKWATCRFDKYVYNPEKADSEYRHTLVDSRIGVNLTSSEAKALADIIAPLLKQGLSPYEILQIHPELNMCEKTLYNYIENGIFHEVAGIAAIDLRRQVGRKMTKKKSSSYKKRQDRRYLNGRTYKDYTAYMNDNPSVFVTQMDTVYNDVINGPFIQTFKFVNAGVLIGIFHEHKTADSMVDGINQLEDILGQDIFKKYVNVLLTDRGTEFTSAELMETAVDGTRRTRVFYCDPMQSGQKGALENNHIALRYILPKGINLKALGLINQSSLNIVMSHINSAPIERFGGKSPLELTEFLYHDLYERLKLWGVYQIEKDNIILKPYLLKSRTK